MNKSEVGLLLSQMEILAASYPVPSIADFATLRQMLEDAPPADFPQEVIATLKQIFTDSEN